MASAYYDINTQQNSTFNFHVEYQDKDGNPVDMTGYSVRLQVRPNTNSNRLYLHISNGEVISGGTAGEFGATGGLAGYGGVYTNIGRTGGSLTGGILFSADAVSMGYVRTGSWKYSIDIAKDGRTDELMSGQFVVGPKVTRLGDSVLPGGTLSFVGVTLALSTNIFGAIIGLTGSAPGQGVLSLNGKTGSLGLQGGTDITVNYSGGTFSVIYTGTSVSNAVNSFNGRTGAVQGVSAAVAGTGISVSGATGTVTVSNTGVLAVNGITGGITLNAGSSVTITSSVAGGITI